MEDKSSVSETVQVQAKKSGSNLKRILFGVCIAVLVIGVGLGGYFYGVSVGQKNNIPGGQFARGQGGPQGAQGQQDPNQTAQPRTGFGGGQADGGISGSIASIDGSTITVTTRTGKVQVKTTDTTLIEKYASVTVNDLAVGEQIIVTGSTNDDGSVTARSIQTMRGVDASPTAKP